MYNFGTQKNTKLNIVGACPRTIIYDEFCGIFADVPEEVTGPGSPWTKGPSADTISILSVFLNKNLKSP